MNLTTETHENLLFCAPLYMVRLHFFTIYTRSVKRQCRARTLFEPIARQLRFLYQNKMVTATVYTNNSKPNTMYVLNVRFRLLPYSKSHDGFVFYSEKEKKK